MKWMGRVTKAVYVPPGLPLKIAQHSEPDTVMLGHGLGTSLLLLALIVC
jgi:hypothetical protein